MWKPCKPRAPHSMVIEVTCGVGEMSKKYRLEVPANTSFDDIEALLTILGAIPPRISYGVDVTPGAHESSFRVER